MLADGCPGGTEEFIHVKLGHDVIIDLQQEAETIPFSRQLTLI